MTNIFYDYKQFLSTRCLAESTQKIYMININLFLNFIKLYKGKVDIITLCNLTRADLYNYMAYIDNLSRNTKKIRLYSIKSFYSFLNQDLSDFLFEDIKIFNQTKKLPKYLFSKQVFQLLGYYSDKRNNLIIFLFLNTGIRISELTNILIQNINFHEKYIYLKVKGGHYRKVFINEQTKNKLIDYLGNKKEGKLFLIKRREVHNIVKKAMMDLKINGSAHTLRHTYATTIYKLTNNILIVKELLGHKSINSTDIYTHLDNETVRKAVESNPLANYKVGGKNEN